MRPSMSLCLDAFLDLGQVIGHEAVRFSMDRRGGVRIRSLDEAPHLARSLVEPVLDVVHPVLVLGLGRVDTGVARVAKSVLC